jgi:hypothetical protein
MSNRSATEGLLVLLRWAAPEANAAALGAEVSE